MRATRLSVDPRDLLPDRAAATLVVGVTAAIAVSFAGYGGVEPWCEVALLLVAIPALGFALVRAFSTPLGASTSVVAGGLLGIALLTLFQLSPLPSAIVSTVSPTRLEATESLAGVAPDYFPISYNAADSRQALRLVCLAAAVFVSIALTARRPQTTTWLLALLFALGVGQSLLSLTQIATDAPGIHWGDVKLGHVRSGSFVNHSNFCQFLNLTLGATVSLLLVRVSGDRRARRAPLTVERFCTRHAWLLVGAMLQVAAIAASLSRAGLIAMVVAASITGLVLTRMGRGGRIAWSFALAVPVAMFVLAWVGSDAVVDRVETLGDEASYSDRIQLTADTVRAGLDHWLVGVGLGAHAAAFPSYDTTGSVAFAEQADNDYAQLFEETGLAGVGLVAVVVVGVLWAIRRTVRDRTDASRYAVVGVLFSLVALAVQALTDFGFRLPAVSCTAAALGGLTCALADAGGSLPTPRSLVRRVGITLCGIAAVGVGGLLLTGAVAEYRAERWWAIAYQLDRWTTRDGWDADPQEYLDLIAAAERAHRIKPDRVKYAFWLNAYRWKAVEFAAQGADPLDTDSGNRSARAIADELAKCRVLCPTYGPAHTLEGQLRIALGDPVGAELLRQGVRLSPNDPVAHLGLASYYLSLPPDADRDAQALEHLQTSVLLDRSLALEAAETVLRSRDDLQAAIELTSVSDRELRELAGVMPEMGLPPEQVDEVLESADRMLTDRVEAGSASGGDIAFLAERRATSGDETEAIALYRQALAKRFDQLSWRLRLADLLMSAGRPEDARKELEVCLRIDPDWRPAKLRLAELARARDDREP